MIYTLQEGQSFDPEQLRVELVKAIGPDGWYLNTAGNTVEFRQDGTLAEVLNPEPTILTHFANGAKRTANAAILKQIAELEATQTPRRIREGGQWMVELDAKIAALRMTLQK